MQNKKPIYYVLAVLLVSSLVFLNYQSNNNELQGSLRNKIKNDGAKLGAVLPNSTIDLYTYSVSFDMSKQELWASVCHNINQDFIDANSKSDISVNVDVELKGDKIIKLERSSAKITLTSQACDKAYFSIPYSLGLTLGQTYTAKAKADPDSKYSETDENNNENSTSFLYDLSSKPDLEVKSIVYDSVSHMATYEICINNYSDSTATVYNGKQVRSNVDINNGANMTNNTHILGTDLANGKCASSTFASPSLNAGDNLKIKINTDTEKVVSESNENNNTKSQDFIY